MRCFIVLFICSLICFVLPTKPQSKLKIGYINSEELLMAMPERSEALKKMQDFVKQLENQLLEMQNELEKKYNDYLQKKDSLSELIRKHKEEEILELQRRIQVFQDNAQNEMRKKEQELLQPIIEKAKNTIEEVAKENGFTYILDVSSPTILYYPKDPQIDILPLVKKKLNLK